MVTSGSVANKPIRKMRGIAYMYTRYFRPRKVNPAKATSDMRLSANRLRRKSELSADILVDNLIPVQLQTIKNKQILIEVWTN